MPTHTGESGHALDPPVQGRMSRDLEGLSSFMARSTRPAPAARPLRVLCATSTPGVTTDPLHVEALMRVAERLTELGHDVGARFP